MAQCFVYKRIQLKVIKYKWKWKYALKNMRQVRIFIGGCHLKPGRGQYNIKFLNRPPFPVSQTSRPSTSLCLENILWLNINQKGKHFIANLIRFFQFMIAIWSNQILHYCVYNHINVNKFNLNTVRKKKCDCKWLWTLVTR